MRLAGNAKPVMVLQYIESLKCLRIGINVKLFSKNIIFYYAVKSSESVF